jgi:hypothetical protein
LGWVKRELFHQKQRMSVLVVHIKHKHLIDLQTKEEPEYLARLQQAF